MVMAPRPLTAISASMAAAGPNASSVTMRRSNASALNSARNGEGEAFSVGRGHTNMAAIASAGSMKKNCPAAKNAGCQM